jgi:ubiquinone/menaquinone biosynthesis C-methylase UbiE
MAKPLKPISQVTKPRFLNPSSIFAQLNMREGMVVADFGCGSGFLTIKAAQLVGDEGTVYGVDVQKSVISELKSKVRLFGLRNINPVWANLEALGSSKISNESVDLVMLVHILHQSKKRNAIMNEAKRVVKPNGKILFVDWKKTGTPLGPSAQLRVEKEVLKKEAESAGFKYVKDIETDDYHYGFLMEKS